MVDSIGKIDPNMSYRQNQRQKPPREGEEDKRPETDKKEKPSRPPGAPPDGRSHLIDIVG